MFITSMICFLIGLIICLQKPSFIGAADAHQSRPYSSVQRGRSQISIEELNKAQKKSPEIDPFPHTKELLSAIQKREKSFSLEEKVSDFDQFDFNSFDDITNKMFYTTIAKFDLFEDSKYISIDDSRTIFEVIEDASIVHCQTNPYHLLEKGDFLVGTHEGNWNKKMSNFGSSQQQQQQQQMGLIFSRKVIAIESHASRQGCLKVQTTKINPLELIDHFEIQSKAEAPYSLDYMTPQAALARGLLKIDLDGFVSYDSPLVACNDDVFNGNGLSKSGDSWSVNLLYSGSAGCVSVGMDVPGSLNFNFDTNTNSAIGPLTLLPSVPSVTCPNCYLVLGAGFLVVVNYFSQGTYLDFEAKMSGNAGFAVNVAFFQRIVYSNSTVVPLLPAASKASDFNLGYGLALSSQFGGLSAVVSGSLNATFSCKFGAGAFASAQIGTMFRNDKSVSNTWSDLTKVPTNQQLSST